jgi:hypothetical protein
MKYQTEEDNRENEYFYVDTLIQRIKSTGKIFCTCRPNFSKLFTAELLQTIRTHLYRTEQCIPNTWAQTNATTHLYKASLPKRNSNSQNHPLNGLMLSTMAGNSRHLRLTLFFVTGTD